jgi:hypothetical protein
VQTDLSNVPGEIVGKQGPSIVLRSFRSPFAIITVILGFTLVSLWSLVLWKSRQEETQAFAKAASESQGLTHLLAQHASKSFGAAALALLGANCVLQDTAFPSNPGRITLKQPALPIGDFKDEKVFVRFRRAADADWRCVGS